MSELANRYATLNTPHLQAVISRLKTQEAALWHFGEDGAMCASGDVGGWGCVDCRVE